VSGGHVQQQEYMVSVLRDGSSDVVWRRSVVTERSTIESVLWAVRATLTEAVLASKFDTIVISRIG